MANQNGNAPANNGAVQKFGENTVESVIKRIGEFTTQGGVKLPPNYSAENAVRSAWLIIQETKNLDKKPALDVCTRESVATAMLDMVLQGLNPVKKQCYFVVYGNKLVMQKSYIGTISVGKRVADIKDVRGVPIYKGDEFAYEIDHQTGIKKITKHVQDFSNIDPAGVIGAYAIVTYNNGSSRAEIMNMKQITASWNMGNAKGQSPAHKNFADEMACKTVISRALKLDIGSTDDGALFDEDGMIQDDVVASHVKQEISENANQEELSIEHEDEGGEYVDVSNETEVEEVPPVKETNTAKQTTFQPGF